MSDHFTNILHLKEFSSFMQHHQYHTIQDKIVLIFEKAKNLFARVTMVLNRAAQMLRTFLKVLQCKNYELFLFTVCFNTRIGRIQDGVVMLVMG